MSDQVSRQQRYPYRRSVGGGLFVVGVAWVPSSVVVSDATVAHLVPLALIGYGLYDLFSSGFLHLFRPAVLITLGIGVQLVTLNVLTPWELLVLWPLGLITFGAIVLISSMLDARSHRASTAR